MRRGKQRPAETALPNKVNPMQRRSNMIVLSLLLTSAAAAFAQADRGAMVRVGSIYIAPDATSAKLADVERGREVVVLGTSRDWLNVAATLTEERVVTGWIKDKGVVRASTPNGDRVLFGEAVDSEDQASQRHGRRGAAQDAMRLYYRVAELFPNSPLAGEAMYRSADIRWQIDKPDVMSRPSTRDSKSPMREDINDDFMKQVMKKFPGTKWADLAAFHLVDNKLCSDWQGSSKCPDKEADAYEKYANEHPQSPAVAEALYDAAWRRAALIEIYKTEDQAKKSEESRSKAMTLAQKAAQASQGDWGARAQRLLYMISQGIPTYGNAED